MRVNAGKFGHLSKSPPWLGGSVSKLQSLAVNFLKNASSPFPTCQHQLAAIYLFFLFLLTIQYVQFHFVSLIFFFL